MPLRLPTMHRSALRFAAVVALLLVFLGSVLGATIVAEGPKLIVNEVTVLTLKSSSVDGATPDERATILASNLLSAPYLGDIKVRKVEKTHVIFVGGIRILTITPPEAKAHKSTTSALAVSWSTRLRTALSTPPLKVKEIYLRLPSPSTKFVAVTGTLAKQAEITSTDPNIASVLAKEGGFEIQANNPGDATIVVNAGTTQAQISVEVRPYAAIFPQTLSAAVVGSPALASTVEGAIRGALKTQLKTVADAQVAIKSIEPTALGSGASRTYQVKLSVESGGAFPRIGTANVVVRNANISSRKEAELWYCNNPETIRQAGPLFSAALRKEVPARLLYHHINESAYPLYLRVQVINDTDQAARVMIIPGDSDPDKNPVRAGLKAAAQYFRALGAYSGEVVTIPPRSTMPISLRRLAPKDTASGLCTLRLIDGPNQILVRTDAWPPFQLDKRWTAAIDSPTPWREVGTNPINEYDRAPSELSPYIYPNPLKEETVRYEVGGRYGFVRIGQRPILREDRAEHLGNFGVLYNIKADVLNSTQDSTEIEVIFEASAGYSGALFVLDGQFIETPLLQPKAEFRIARFRLGPGESRKLDISTIPLSGSSYPATLTIRPVQELSKGVPGGR
ncbi:hypothetical protein EON81_01545 [bacterium]|nr:MAG: hypothetical protein EON81_01545 [bacterium]